MNRWGLTIPLTGVPLMEHRALVEQLPDLGYTDAWTAETAKGRSATPGGALADPVPDQQDDQGDDE